MIRSDSHLAQAIDIHAWLADDVTTPMAERLARDRTLAGEMRPTAGETELVLAWWSSLRVDARADPAAGDISSGERIATVRGYLAPAVFVLGVVAGVVAASIGFRYDGAAPINLLALFALFVLVPGLLLGLTLLALLASRFGFGGLSRALLVFNLNRWIVGWWQRVGDARLDLRFAQNGAGARLAQWQLLVLSQWLAIGFFLGAVALALVQVAIADLAFGWSSTLEISAPAIHGAIAVLASPWSAFVPAAVPSLELVEGSRFFRLGDAQAPLSADALGAWWPFVLLTMLVWGLLPRLIVLWWGGTRLNRAIDHYLRSDPEVTALLRRLGAFDAEVSFAATQEVANTPAGEPVAADEFEHLPLPPDARFIVTWNNPPGNLSATELDEGPVVCHVDSRQTPQTQHELLRAVGDAGVVAVITKSWEPPVLEFFDMLERLQLVLDVDAAIGVRPMGLNGQLPQPRDVEIWRAALARHGDERVFLDEPA